MASLPSWVHPKGVGGSLAFEPSLTILQDFKKALELMERIR